MKKLLPIILIVVGLGAGIGAGAFLRPAPEPEAECAADDTECAEAAAEKEKSYTENSAPIETSFDPDNPTEFVKLPKQFVVPIIKRDRVAALVVLSISLEVDAGTTDVVFSRGPKLRDAFLQVLFAHANSGGFDGSFTTGQSMYDLRGKLNEAARRHTGQTIHEVLITDLVKQGV